MRDASTLTRPQFAMPAGACDSHVHAFGPPERFPSVAHPHYTLPDGKPALLERMTRALGIERCAIVQPSYYGTDNSCMLDALEQLGPRARGVAMVEDDAGHEALEDLHRRGVRALRLDLFLRAQWPTADIAAYIFRSIERIRDLGWHVQFYTPGCIVRDLIPVLAELESDFVIDHMGYMLESDGLTRADFDRLIDVAARGHGWMKLSGPYRIAKDGNYEKLAPLARAIVEALGERTIWGSDWPHIPNGRMDTGELLNLLFRWVPDARQRDRILRDNPARLYGFAP
jgi:predicted TIM-barrel fold metal-dependent hydrolase